MWVSVCATLSSLLLCLNTVAEGWSCSYEETQSYCRCTTEDKDFNTMSVCANASTFEILGKYLEEVPIELQAFLSKLHTSDPKRIILKKVNVSDSFVNHVGGGFLGSLEIEDSEYTGIGHWTFKNKNYPILTSVWIVNVTIVEFYKFYSLHYLGRTLKALRNVTVIQCNLFLIPCEGSKQMTNLEYLDLSENKLQDIAMTMSVCPGGYPKLRVLKLRKNYLKSYQTLCNTLSKLSKLTHLDLSQHDFSKPPLSCSWQQSFQIFNLSDTRLNHIQNYLPATVEILDLSKNRLAVLDITLPTVKKLYLSNNVLQELPPAQNCPNVEVLCIETNKLTDIKKERLLAFRNLKYLKAGRNMYSCSCEFMSEIPDLMSAAAFVKDWPDDYVCETPSHHKGSKVKDVQLSLLECHRSLVLVLISGGTLIVLCILGFIWYKTHATWYLRMAWQWLQAKRRTVKATTDLNAKFDAFISYSESDSEWVDNFLVPQLENTNEPFKLCLHKRDFLPGKWIMDNIIESIEESRKTLFVISKHFVSSEWCKYELEFSQHRFFDENNDFVILVLLEPIPRECIPRRFCKLHKLMSKNTYLEWPEEDDQQGIFWEKLRTALTSQ
ncbi:toll-like receptor 2 type-2 [Huso huso]|uniref:Toll-like receptor 2 type-2 n=1 Tax=Huso huso TaxID=61971 RepID=A0ABR0YQ13_HUSHU